MTFYESLKFLVLGTRMRRLSEAMLADINAMYEMNGAKFDAFWFPVFYILSRNENVTNKLLKEELQITHSAVSQLLSGLQGKGYITTVAAEDDARKKIIIFTKEGKAMLKKIEPIWVALQQATEELAMEAEESKNILAAIAALERNLKKKPLQDRVKILLQ